MAILSGVHLESSEHEPILSDEEQDTGADGEDTTLESEGDVHIATRAEKKRLWWKNALVNTFFILTWYDASKPHVFLEPLSTSVQVPFCNGALRV